MNSLYNFFSNFKFDDDDDDDDDNDDAKNPYHASMKSVNLSAQSTYLKIRRWFSENTALQKVILKVTYQKYTQS